MPHGDATADENSVPPWTRGDFRGVLNAGTNPPRRCGTALAVVRSVADEHSTPTTPAVAVGPGIPSSIEEGSLFQEEFFMPPSGATGGENSLPPWTRGDFRGVLKSGTHLGAARHPSDGGEFSEEFKWLL